MKLRGKSEMRKTKRVYSCDDVPCGKCLKYKECQPDYCHSYSNNDSSSRNWCNEIKDETLYKTKYKEMYVNANTLHKKMPYIWRFLRKGTRKEMIRLAQLPINKINIPFTIFSKHKDSNIRKKARTLKKRYKDI